jgi:multiple sugar transport system ATP-binding protein
VDLMDRPFLSVRGLEKRFGRVPALDGVDLEVGAGELLVVLGPTGAGKTTLLRAIAGLETPDRGEVLVQGRDVTGLLPAQRDVALVFQNFSLYPGWSVRANLEFPLRAPGRGMNAAQIAERVEWAAELLHITALLERDSRKLSGGEMQRVAIGRAIVRRPRLFLMDEPLSNLDAKLREQLRVELVQLARQLETPLVYVTHDQAEALSMADRICVLAEGRVHQSGTPREVYLRPSSPLVAKQLGQPPINLFEARREGDRWLSADGTFLAPAAPDAPERATLGIRPEHVQPRGGDTPGVVEVAEETGPERVLLARWAGARIHVLCGRSIALRAGHPIEPRLDPEHVLVWK